MLYADLVAVEEDCQRAEVVDEHLVCLLTGVVDVVLYVLQCSVYLAVHRASD